MPSKTMLIMFLLLFCVNSGTSDSESNEFFVVSEHEFVEKVQYAIDKVQKVVSLVSPHVHAVNDSRLENAIFDGLDLMDMSMDQLRFTLSARNYSVHENYMESAITCKPITMASLGKISLTLEYQAVAFRSNSDLSVIFQCGFRGYQDTLYAHSSRQFYSQCVIRGNVDFVFGRSAAVFQNCTILARSGLPNQKNTVAAQGRTYPINQQSGFSFQFCKFSGEPDLLNTTKTYLGRPWKNFSTTVVMESYIGGIVNPAGWLEFNGSFALDTLFFGEFGNYGPGTKLTGRVQWPGFHILNATEAMNFTVAELIQGDLWLPKIGARYTGGLGFK